MPPVSDDVLIRFLIRALMVTVVIERMRVRANKHLVMLIHVALINSKIEKLRALDHAKAFTIRPLQCLPSEYYGCVVSGVILP